MMGFKNDWRTAGIEKVNEYHGMIVLVQYILSVHIFVVC